MNDEIVQHSAAIAILARRAVTTGLSDAEMSSLIEHANAVAELAEGL